MNSLPVWPIMLPLVGALLTLVWPRHCAWIGFSASLATLVSGVLLVWHVATQGTLIHALGGWQPGLGIALRVDALAAALLMMSSLVTLAAGWYATGYFSSGTKQSQFWPIWLLMVTALHALLLSADLFNLYVTLELLSLSAVSLAALGGGRAAVAAALRYLTVGLLGSMVFLAGVALVYARYGTLDMVALAQLVEPEPRNCQRASG